jgi:hypothetical protein
MAKKTDDMDDSDELFSNEKDQPIKPKRPRARSTPPEYSKEQLDQLRDRNFARKMEATDAAINVRRDDQWEKLHRDWESWDDDARKDAVFGLAYYSGFKVRDIARLFRVKSADLKQYAEIIDQGLVALKLKITSNQIAFGLLTDQPVIKFHLGKQFAEQVDNPAHEGVSSVETAPPAIIINEVKGDNSELRAELDAQVQAAMAVANARTATKQ